MNFKSLSLACLALSQAALVVTQPLFSVADLNKIRARPDLVTLLDRIYKIRFGYDNNWRIGWLEWYHKLAEPAPGIHIPDDLREASRNQVPDYLRSLQRSFTSQFYQKARPHGIEASTGFAYANLEELRLAVEYVTRSR